MRQMFLLFSLLIAPSLASACLIPGSGAPSLEASGPDLYVPVRFMVAAGGEVALPCDGRETASEGQSAYVSRRPSARFELSDMGPHILGVRAYSDCQALLLVHTASGHWVFGRDLREAPESGHGQELYLWAAGDGPLRVWVGTVTGESCPAEIELETYDQ